MNGNEPVEQVADIEFEITDLDKPNEPVGRICSWFVDRILSWQQPGNRRRFRFASIFCISLIFMLVILPANENGLSLLIFTFTHPRSDLYSVAIPQTSSKIVPGITSPTHYHVQSQDGIACLVDAQWSPDSSLIVVLGYQHDCPEVNNVPGIMNIYNAYSKKLVAQWQTDDTILNIFNPTLHFSGTAISSLGTAIAKSANDGAGRVLAFNYLHVLWSPDGHRIAVSFLTSVKQQRMHGILLMDVDGRHTQLLMQTQNDANQSTFEWDLQSGIAFPLQPVLPALRYHWGSNGTLVPEMLLSYDSVPTIGTAVGIGSPEGKNSFTIWQPGYTALTNISGLSVWSTNFEAWSPDGRFLIDSISQSGLMEPQSHPVLDKQALEQMRIAGMPLLPVHDKALFRVASTSSVVAWRPDGRILAAFTYYDAVNLYDCSTGHKIASLPLPFRNQPLAGSTALLRWSPNGAQLLLSSAWGGAKLLWGPGQLPQ